ncbi:cytochrome P450 1A1-like [Ptychodera flava]|uniref:cytochrome P450 1A1-like n=1 Tax=Ptychodera flava TaxID=63121 RepID=UPI00396A7F4D
MQLIMMLVELRDIVKNTISTSFLTLCVLLLALTFIRKSAKRKMDLPGPWGLPIFGSALWMGERPHLTLTKMAKKYGPIYQIRLGTKPFVVLTGLRLIKQALGKQAVEFAGRPAFDSFRSVFNGNSVSFSTYSERWKKMKKIQHSGVKMNLSGTRLNDLEGVILDQAKNIVKQVTAEIKDSHGYIFNPNDGIRFALGNVTYFILFNRTFAYEDKDLKRLVLLSDLFSKATQAANPADVMPWTKIVPSINKRQTDFLKLWNDIGDWIADMIAKLKSGDGRQGSVIDFTDYVMKIRDEITQEELTSLKMDRSTIMTTIDEFFAASFETVASCILWCVLYMMEYPDVQSRVQKELDQVVGPDRTPCLDDKPNLPYTQACIHEMMRCMSVVPLAIPHATTCDTELNGHFIPKDTAVLINIYGTNHDETVFQNPHDFDPDRFLTEDGAALDKAKIEDHISFSLGRRRCIGEPLAHMKVYLLFVTMMYHCTFRKVSDDQVLDFRGNFGLAVQPDHFDVLVNRRATKAED